MKKIILTFVALLSMTMAMAQNDNCKEQAPRRMTAEKMTAMMSNKLDLNDAQKEKVEALNKKYQNLFEHPMRSHRFQGMDSNSGPTQRPEMTDEMKTKMKERMAERKEYKNQLKSILSDSQYQTYQKMMPGRGHGRYHGGNNKEQPSDNQ
jgi:Spy/CpxP family protein refolding chaperone